MNILMTTIKTVETITFEYENNDQGLKEVVYYLDDRFGEGNWKLLNLQKSVGKYNTLRATIEGERTNNTTNTHTPQVINM